MRLSELITPGIVLAALLLIYGLVICFAGFRLFFAYLAFLGSLLGGIAGFLLGSLFGSTIAAVILAVIIGIVGGLLFVASFVVGLFIFGGTLACVLTFAYTGNIHTTPKILFGVLAFTLGGVLALVLGKFFIIAGTAFEGAASAVIACWSLFLHKEITAAFDAVRRGDLLRDLSQGGRQAIILFAAFAVLFIAGVLTQYTSGPSKTSGP
ncbi:MAG: DUF4203 domain-containing protein [Planctomycetota bacterium]